jgi:putative peptidoglycan binding protein
MKTKFLWVALLASAALIAQAQAGGRYGGGGGGGGHFVAAPHAAPARGGAPAFRSMPMRSFGGGRFYSGQGFSPMGMRRPSTATFHQRSIGSNGSAFARTPQLAHESSDRSGRLAVSSNRTNLASANSRREGSRADQFRRGSNNLPPNWRNHVFAQHSAEWHRDWNRGREHWWHGHRCRFVNGSWFIFDFGFYPWWPYGYPGYYAYDYYPYGYAPGGYYDPGVYEGEEYSDQNSYELPDQNADSIIAAAQEQLSREGYYRGAIDAVISPETRRAIARYQGNHGLRVTGYLTTETLQALGMGNVATN